MTDYSSSAKDIIRLVGGASNITKVIHCATRLRFSLNDFDKADVEGLKKVPGVLGAVIAAGQCQVVVGNDVVEMFDAVHAQIGNGTGHSADTSQPKMKPGAVFLDFLIGVFQPLVPAIAGGGVLKSLLLLASSLGWMSATSNTYAILNMIGSAPLTFLPILVAYTTAAKLNVNPLVAMSAVATTLLPDMTAALAKGTTLFGFHVTNIAYASQVFPAILTVLLYAVMERVLTKYTPKAIRIFFVPMVALLITVPLSLLILGPAGYVFGEGFSSVVIFLYTHLGWVGTALLAAVLPLIVSLGMHKAFIPYAVAQIANGTGEPLYLPASLAHNLAECGVCFGVAIRTKDKNLRATAISAGISALFGITEPSIYGVALQHKRALFSVMATGAISGAFIGIFSIKAFVLVGPGIASLSMFTSPTDSMNIVWASVAAALTIVVGFIISAITWRDQTTAETGDEADTISVNATTLVAPVAGTVEPLSQVDDSVFSSGTLGEGVAIIPSEGKLYAPIDGTITMLYQTKHALGLTTANGVEVLFHIGIDTVNMKGDGFTAHVEQGQTVKKGDLLMEFDITKIADEGFDPTVMMIVTNKNEQEVALPAALA